VQPERLLRLKQRKEAYMLAAKDTHETAATQFVQVAGNRLAYRRFGQPSDCPLLLLNYFSASMDEWDPKVTNGLAAHREIILFDNVGVAASAGKTPSTVAAMTKDCVNFCNALNLKKMDVLGFSLGGMIAQHLAFQHPDMVRRMILMGTGPMGGEGLTFGEALLDNLKDPVALLMRSFFTPSGSSQAAGRDYIGRLQGPRRSRLHDNFGRTTERHPKVGCRTLKQSLRDVAEDSPARAGRTWKQGRRCYSNQRFPLRTASARCTARDVSGRQSRSGTATCRLLSRACAAVSGRVNARARGLLSGSLNPMSSYKRLCNE
jgi:pimeloyl-ACP methyl ester carboxylesterase